MGNGLIAGLLLAKYDNGEEKLLVWVIALLDGFAASGGGSNAKHV